MDYVILTTIPFIPWSTLVVNTKSLVHYSAEQMACIKAWQRVPKPSDVYLKAMFKAEYKIKAYFMTTTFANVIN